MRSNVVVVKGKGKKYKGHGGGFKKFGKFKHKGFKGGKGLFFRVDVGEFEQF
jgi:hypothetical protein